MKSATKMQVTKSDVVGFPSEVDSFSTRLHTDVESWLPFEEQLTRAGLALPASWRSSWARHHAGDCMLFVSASEPRDGACVAAAALVVTPTRALPGHFVVHGERMGVARTERAQNAILTSLAQWAASCPRLLRLELGTFSRDGATLESMGWELARLGFRRAADPRMYESTIVLDLSGSEEEILAGFHPTARRHIRAPSKRPFLEIRRIVSDEHVDEMHRLVAETRERTSGSTGQRPWREHIAFARDCPDAAMFVGLFHRGNGALLAFASGHRHGDHAVYADAASTRRAGVNLPLGYALAWEIIRWAKDSGAQWFDFGGITPGTFAKPHHEERDPLGGISDFKRYFRGHEQPVSEEWVLEPHWGRAIVANVVSAGAAWVRQGRHRLRPSRTSSSHQASAVG
jgi:hypothetical protein